MTRVTVVVHGDLRDFLPDRIGASPLERSVNGRPAAKDVLESLGIPHPEIAAITVNGAPARFGLQLRDGDRVEAWPADLATVEHLPSATGSTAVPGEPRFVLDGHLGRLAAYLRMLGFDTWYRNDAADGHLAEVAAAEHRILLTRDRGLLKRSIVERGAWVRSDRPIEQLAEIVRRFELTGRWQPFGRCLRCNTPLVQATRDEVLDRLQPLTRIYYDDFRRCPGCGGVYWKGSHHARMARLVELIQGRTSGAGFA